MNSLKNYILFGKGIAAKYIALLSLLFTVLICFGLGDYYNFIAEQFGAIPNRIAPLEIKNGVLTQPTNQILKDEIFLDDAKSFSLPIVIDATTDSIETSDLPQGIYLSRTKIYVKSNSKTEVRNFPQNGSFLLEPRDYTNEIMDYKFVILAYCTLILFVIFFLWMLLYTLVVAVCSYLVSAILRKDYTLDQRMRLSFLLLVFISACEFVGVFFGYSLSFFMKLLIILVLQALFMIKGYSQKSETDKKL